MFLEIYSLHPNPLLTPTPFSTIVLSPLLPAVLVIGQSVASERLRKQGIMCVDLNRITLGGKVKVFAFDKTGTLTKEGLDFRGIHSAVNSSGIPDFQQRMQTTFSEFPALMKRAMVTAHSLTLVNNEYVGNFVDIEMFRATGALLHISEDAVTTVSPPPGSDPSMKSVRIVKRFEFVHKHAYMSVVCQSPGEMFGHIFLKG